MPIFQNLQPPLSDSPSDPHGATEGFARCNAILREMRAVVGSAAFVCATLAACSGSARADETLVGAGAALFTGATAITAHLAGDADELPGIASRCVNCHERETTPVGGAGTKQLAAVQPPRKGERSTVAGTYASVLDRAWLTTARVRHGGPSTAYDAASFCTLVRSSIDPASVLVPSVMPRYDATDAQCESLWAFLRSR